MFVDHQPYSQQAISMLKLSPVIFLVLGLTVLAPCFAAEVLSGKSSSGFNQKQLGLQLYSLRAQFAKDVPGTLDKVRDMGFKYVETAGTYGLPPAKFKKELDAR